MLLDHYLDNIFFMFSFIILFGTTQLQLVYTIIFHFSFSPSRPFLIERVDWSKNLFSESSSERPHYYREVISDFWFGGSKFVCLPRRGKANKKGLGSKRNLAKVVWSGHITIEKWSQIFDWGGLRLVCPPLMGEGKQKVARIKKLIWQKLIRMPILM